MNFLINLSDIGVAINQALRSFSGTICGWIYDFMRGIYGIFELLSKAEILNNDIVNEIYKKVGLILGIFMIFKLSFSLIQSLIDPNKLSDKKNGFTSIIARCVLAIIMLGITPMAFREAFSLQNTLIGSRNSDNILYKLIMGNEVSDSVSFGTQLSKDLFFQFYTDDDGNFDHGVVALQYVTQDGTKDIELEYKNYEGLKNSIDDKVSFTTLSPYLSFVDEYGIYYIEFDFLGCLIVGIVVDWLLLMFCIQIAIRVFKLAFLQLVAPVPILSYISEPEGSFTKWLKTCGYTFLDLFLRLVIIYFVVRLSTYFLNQVDTVGSKLFTSTGLNQNSPELKWVIVFLIIGLLLFAKKVPELLKQIFPNIDGGFDFGFKDFKNVVTKPASAGVGIAMGAVGGMASNAVHGFMNARKDFKEKGIGAGFKSIGKGALSIVGGAIGGARIGGMSGFKNKKIPNFKATVAQSNENREKRELKQAADYHWYNVPPDKVLAFAGEKTTAEKKIKAAEFRRDALQQSKRIQWEQFSQTHRGSDLSLLQSLQEFEEHGNKVWKGIDSQGKERTYSVTRNGAGQIVSLTPTNGGPGLNIAEIGIVNTSANIDKEVRNQNKIIKGLQTADSDAKKGK